MPSSRGSSWPRDWIHISYVSCIGSRVLYHQHHLGSPLLLSVQFSHSVVSNSLRPHEPQHARLPYPLPTPGVHPNSCPLSQWSHPTISSSVVPFSSCPQSFPASESHQMSQLFSSSGQRTVVSASTSVLPMNTEGWSPVKSTTRCCFCFESIPSFFVISPLISNSILGTYLPGEFLFQYPIIFIINVPYFKTTTCLPIIFQR